MNNDEEKVWYTHEILQVLFGLGNFYYTRPWYTRWLWKPWHDALQTAAVIIGGNQLLEEADNVELINTVEDFLDRE